MTETKNNVQRNYKDTLFRHIFNNKVNLLSLYNAINGTAYENSEDIKINTLENAVYLNMKNDVSCVIGFHLNLYEHQSTYNPNMPLRDLFYIARLLEGELGNKSIYSTKLIKMPTPKFLVFYNGTEEQPECRIQRLSEAFEKPESTSTISESSDLELKVTMLNINIGKNKELMEQCRALKEYMIYVDKVRKYTAFMELEAAVNRAVDECIQENVLRDYLTKYRAEAIQVSIFEFDEEREMKLIREAEREIGWEEGREIGWEEGRERYNKLILKLIESNQSNLIEKMAKDPELLNKLFEEYNL